MMVVNFLPFDRRSCETAANGRYAGRMAPQTYSLTTQYPHLSSIRHTRHVYRYVQGTLTEINVAWEIRMYVQHVGVDRRSLK